MNIIKITLASALGLVLIAPGATAQEPVRSKDKPNVERVKRQKDGPTARGTERAGGDAQGKERPDAKRPDKQRPETERPDAKRPDKERPAKGVDGKKVTEAEMVRMAMQEEAKHRDRIAKINRLREVLGKQGDRTKLAKLDKMEESENARYDRMVAKAKSMLGDAKFNEIQGKMSKGRGAKRPAGERPAGERPVGERPGKDRPVEKRPEGGR